MERCPKTLIEITGNLKFQQTKFHQHFIVSVFVDIWQTLCSESWRSTVRESSRAHQSYAICPSCIRTNRCVSRANDADTSSLRLAHFVKFITSSSMVKAFFMSATSQLSHYCANGVLRLSTYSTSFCTQLQDHFGPSCTHSSKFFAATSAAIILFMIFEAAATIDLSSDVVALAFLCAEPPSPFARCEDPHARLDGVSTGEGVGCGGVCGVSSMLGSWMCSGQRRPPCRCSLLCTVPTPLRTPSV